MPVVLGMDIGGTSIKLGAWDMPAGTRLGWRGNIRIPQTGEPSEVLGYISTELRSFCDECQGASGTAVKALGIGSCGLIRSGVILESPNTPWQSLPLTLPLSQALGVPVTVINDADAFLLGALDMSASAGKLVLGITLGTGIGTAIWLGDRLLNGGSGISPEAGHITIEACGEPGATGIPGDWEHVAGKASIQRYFERYGGAGGTEPHEIAQAARAGNHAAISAWSEYGRFLGIGLASLCNVFSPTEIVVGGGLSGAHDLFEPALLNGLGRHMLAAMPRPALRYVDDAGDMVALGAARLAARKLT